MLVCLRILFGGKHPFVKGCRAIARASIAHALRPPPPGRRTEPGICTRFVVLIRTSGQLSEGCFGIDGLRARGSRDGDPTPRGLAGRGYPLPPARAPAPAPVKCRETGLERLRRIVFTQISSHCSLSSTRTGPMLAMMTAKRSANLASYGKPRVMARGFS